MCVVFFEKLIAELHVVENAADLDLARIDWRDTERLKENARAVIRRIGCRAARKSEHLAPEQPIDAGEEAGLPAIDGEGAKNLRIHAAAAAGAAANEAGEEWAEDSFMKGSDVGLSPRGRHRSLPRGEEVEKHFRRVPGVRRGELLLDVDRV